MARPKVEIDAALVERMASWGCKTVEIADWFGVSDQTITSRFMAELTKGRSSLKTNLRQWQLTSAKAGNATMLIWLGKQLLGQQEVKADLSQIPDEIFQQEAERRIKLVGNS